jgi:uncharacterized membrane protein YkvA (DUF1232 family)
VTWQHCLPLLALLYLVSPFDVVPDFLPLIGWLDDLALIAALAYMAWCRLKQPE